MYKGIEKRKHKRIEKPFMARFRVIYSKNLHMPPAYWIKISLKDISAGGVSFNYNENLGIDLFLDLQIDLSESTPIINCVGKVTRIEHPQPNSMFRIATEITEIEEHEKKIINTTIEKALE